jgi:hypothetical protein
MKARVSDEFDLVLSWEDSGRSQITWSACSDCEFEVKATIVLNGGVHYQGPTRFEFTTVCYAYSLRGFADELREFVTGQKDSARYYGSQDMEILIHPREGQAAAKGQWITACDLRFELNRCLDMIYCGGHYKVTLGRLEEPEKLIRSIEEVLRFFKMKDGLDS